MKFISGIFNDSRSLNWSHIEKIKVIKQVIQSKVKKTSNDFYKFNKYPKDSSLTDALISIPNTTNKVCLQIAWEQIPLFQRKHNLLWSNEATFIRKTLKPKGLLVHMHREADGSVWAYHLVENPEIQEIFLVKLCL